MPPFCNIAYNGGWGWARLPCSTGGRNYISNCKKKHKWAREHTWGRLLGGEIRASLGSGGRSMHRVGDRGPPLEKLHRLCFNSGKLAIQHLYCFCLFYKASPSPNGGCSKTLQSRLCLSSSCPWLLGTAGTHWAVANRHQLHVDPWLLGSAVPLSSTFCQRCF